MTITSATLGQERCYSSCSEWEGGGAKSGIPTAGLDELIGGLRSVIWG
jgi:hypothetical protein